MLLGDESGDGDGDGVDGVIVMYGPTLTGPMIGAAIVVRPKMRLVLLRERSRRRVLRLHLFITAYSTPYTRCNITE